MEQQKDYSMLRPFDLEAAKRGEKICWHKQGCDIAFVGAMSNGQIVYEYIQEQIISSCNSSQFRMLPLAWVEGRPVYKLDVLWHEKQNKYVKVHALGDYSVPTVVEECCDMGFLVDSLTWKKTQNEARGAG